LHNGGAIELQNYFKDCEKLQEILLIAFPNDTDILAGGFKFYFSFDESNLTWACDDATDKPKILLFQITPIEVNPTNINEGSISLTENQEIEKQFGYGDAEFELQSCEVCFQMTNHLNGICQKCKPLESVSVEDLFLINYDCVADIGSENIYKPQPMAMTQSKFIEVVSRYMAQSQPSQPDALLVEAVELLKTVFDYPKDDMVGWANGTEMIPITLQPKDFEAINTFLSKYESNLK